MLILKSFNDFLFERIFENKLELTIGISKRLEELLMEIDHEVAKDLLELSTNNIKSDKLTLIDYDEKEYNKFTYIIPNKLLDLMVKKTNQSKEHITGLLLNIDSEDGKFIRLSRNTKEAWDPKTRTSQSIGKIINKIFPSKYDTPKKKDDSDVVRNYLEEFTNLIIQERKKQEDEPFKNFKIVKGPLINKYYSESSYDSSAGSSTLGNSCMRYEKCDDYIDFYSQNTGVDLVILMSSDEEDKILGRALLWDIQQVENEKVDRKFLDRIYTIYDSDVNLFKELAKKNGWLYKKRQISIEDEPIIDPVNDITVNRIKSTSTFEETGQYPYLDTLKYYYYYDGGFLTNYEIRDESYYKLESTSGDYEHIDVDSGRIWVEYYDRYFYDDDDDLVYCEFGDEYRLLDDCYQVGGIPTIEYATKEYAKENLLYSEETEMYYPKEYVVWSNYHDTYVPKSESLKIYTNNASDKPFDEIYDNPHFIDYVLDEDFTILEYYKHNMYFNIDEKDNFMFVKSLLKDGNKKVWVHKKWDRDKIFIMDGEHWIHDSTDEDFYSLKGNIKLLGEKKKI